MKVLLIVVGKTDEPYLEQGIIKYVNRLVHYLPFELKVLPDVRRNRNTSFELQKKMEGDLILNQFAAGDEVFLLDENGKHFSSRSFSGFIEKKLMTGVKRLVFVIGGPYGFSQGVYEKATGRISLSEMTFSHQMVRLIFVEQLYRGMSIIKGEPYHHD